jgi:outer membrane protein TolC
MEKNMTDLPQPSPEFVKNLEWQIQTSVRRKNRFSRPVSRTPVRIVQLAALVVISVFVGAAGVVATEQVQESKQKQLEIAKMEYQLQIAELQLQYRQVQLEELQRQHQAGLVNEEALKAAEHGVQEAEAELAQLRLNMEEIRLSGREPLDDIAAPLVGDRDFVSDRLRLMFEVANARQAAVETRLARVRTLREAGLARQPDEQEMQAALMEAQFRVRNIQTQMQLRQRFLNEEISKDDLEKELKLVEARNSLQMLEQRMQVLRIRFARVQQLHEQNMVSRLEVLQSELQLRELEAELQLTRLRIEMLQSGDQPPPLRGTVVPPV